MDKGMWRHCNCTDVDVEILSLKYRHPEYVKARVRYWRRDWGWGGFLLDQEPETVKILRKDFKNWSWIG